MYVTLNYLLLHVRCLLKPDVQVAIKTTTETASTDNPVANVPVEIWDISFSDLYVVLVHVRAAVIGARPC
jgi:hypothetical protein